MVSVYSSFGHQLPTRNIGVVSSSRTSPVAFHAVQHLMGQTLIPTHPQRVVVLDPWIVEIPLAWWVFQMRLKLSKG